MGKIRISKISGDKLIEVVSTKKNGSVAYVEGSVITAYPAWPTVGYPFGVYGEKVFFKTSPVEEILSENTFRTSNSTYKWEAVK